MIHIEKRDIEIVHDEFQNGLEHPARPCRERLSLSSFLSILTHKRLLLLAFLRFSHYPLDFFCAIFKSTLRGLPKLITLEFPNRFKNQFQNSILYMIESLLELQLVYSVSVMLFVSIFGLFYYNNLRDHLGKKFF